MEDQLKEMWSTYYRLCRKAGVPQEELDQCTKTADLIRLLRKVRDRDRERAKIRKIDKRFRNRDRKQHE